MRKNSVFAFITFILLFSLIFSACSSSTGSDSDIPDKDLPPASVILTDLSIKGTRLSPDFSPEISSYSASVSRYTPSVTVTPVANFPESQITINGEDIDSGTTSDPITLQMGDNPITIEVTSADGEAQFAYHVSLDRVFLEDQDAYVKASNTGEGDEFGSSVAVWDNTVVVGAPLEDGGSTGVNGLEYDNTRNNSGAAYIYERTDLGWEKTNYLKASNTDRDDQFGMSVAIDGNTIVIGAPFEDSDATGVNDMVNHGNNYKADSGAAYVFIKEGNQWIQQAYLKAFNTDQWDEFGKSVAISGDTIAIGAPGEDSKDVGVNGTGTNNFSTNSGAVYIFKRNAGIWKQTAYIKACNTDIDDNFGISVALSGKTLVVGAPHEESNSTQNDVGIQNNEMPSSGAAYVFTNHGLVWSQKHYLKATNTDSGDLFGHDVAVFQNTIAIGAPGEDSNATGIEGEQFNNALPESGAVYMLIQENGVFQHFAYIKASNTGDLDNFGWCVSLTRDSLMVGAPYEESNAVGIDGDGTNNSKEASGAAYAFMVEGMDLAEQAYIKASNTDSSDWFGFDIAISEDIAIIGAKQEDSASRDINLGEDDNAMQRSGAAYIF